MENITARLSCSINLQAAMSTPANLVGQISVASNKVFDTYDGEYNVIPKPHQEQVLETANKLMIDDVTVAAIPYYEVSNVTGKTIYIGKEMLVSGNQ